MSDSALTDFLYGPKEEGYWLDQRYDAYTTPISTTKENPMSIPTPKAVHDVQELLQSTQPISDEQKKEIEDLFDGDGERKVKKPFVPKPHLTQRPFQGNDQLQQLRNRLAAEETRSQKGRK